MGEWNEADLNIVSLMIVTALAEQTVVNNVVNVQLIQEGITILEGNQYITHLQQYKAG